MIKPGTIIYADRIFYYHYGVYIGDNKVVNYKGAPGHETDAKTAMIRVSTLEDFLAGSRLYIDPLKETYIHYSDEDTVRRALSKVGCGLGHYNLLIHNCEHFANWCRYGSPHSDQITRGIRRVTDIIGYFVTKNPRYLAESFRRKSDGEMVEVGNC